MLHSNSPISPENPSDIDGKAAIFTNTAMKMMIPELEAGHISRSFESI